MTYIEKLGDAIRAERIKKRISRNELHYRTRLAYPTIEFIERGERHMRLSSLIKICEVLEVKPSELLSMAER